MMVKHLVYAEDVLCELTQHPDFVSHKQELDRLINKIVKEKEVSICTFMPNIDWEADGDLYD